MTQVDTIQLILRGEGITGNRSITPLLSALLKDIITEAHIDCGYKRSDDQELFVFLESRDDEIDVREILIADLGIRDGGTVFVHGCRNIHVTVDYKGRQHSQHFKPNVRVAELLQWAIKAFNLPGDEEAALAQSEHAPHLDPHQHIGQIHEAPGCDLRLVLVAHQRTAHHHVRVHNEENGSNIEILATDDTTINMVIAEMYEKFHITPKDDDRLSCEATGQDVLVFRAMTLKEYIAAGQCHKLEWLFVGGTGGAQEC